MVLFLVFLCSGPFASVLADPSVESKPASDQLPQSVADLQDQLKISQKVQAEQLSELKTAREEMARQKGQLETLEKEKNKLERVLSQKEEQMDLVELDRKALQRELSDVQNSSRRSSVEIEAMQMRFSAETESMRLELKRLREDPRKAPEIPAAPPAPAEVPKPAPAPPKISQGVVPTPAPPKISQEVVPAQPASPADTLVKVYRVEEKLGFLVFSVANISWAKPGQAMLLSSGGQEIAEVELGDIDNTGMAMAYITKRVNEKLPIQRGESVAVQQVPPAPASSGSADREEANRPAPK